jgi:hypothetical protein
VTATDPRQTTPLARLSAFAGEHQAVVSITFVPDVDGRWLVGMAYDDGHAPAHAIDRDPEEAIVEVLRQVGW